MKVRNENGRIMDISEEDFRLASANGLKFVVVEHFDVPYSGAKIGVLLQRYFTREKNCASDRIRGDWVIKHSQIMEVYREGVNYEAVIYHCPSNKPYDYNGIKILDICDEVWKDDVRKFIENIRRIDAITVPTEALKAELGKITDKKIIVIPDGHDFGYYSTKTNNEHKQKAKTVVWFGYSANFEPMRELVGEIERHGLKLKVISDYPVGFGEFVKWDVDTCIEEISRCDFAILPKHREYKSDNKDLTAILSGIPVAKTKTDIVRLIDPKERQKEMKKFSHIVHNYDVSLRAKEYEALIEDLKSKNPTVYTAINGGYEKPRGDIRVFYDSEKDKFIQPVMNAKIYKVLPHRFLKCDRSVWIDGNIHPLENDETIASMLGDADIALFRHPQRNCVYQEANPAKERVPDKYKELIFQQIEDYKNEGFPEGFGLWECLMIIRRHNEATRELNERWWAEICRYSQRDQLSFPYVLWKMGDKIKVKTLEGNIRSHTFFRYDGHAKN